MIEEPPMSAEPQKSRFQVLMQDAIDELETREYLDAWEAHALDTALGFALAGRWEEGQDMLVRAVAPRGERPNFNGSMVRSEMPLDYFRSQLTALEHRADATIEASSAVLRPNRAS
jgi:hypothetical protein